MPAARNRQLISVDDYLDAEERSRTKHEYVAGVVYAMAGINNAHGIIAINIVLATGIRLPGKPCRTFGSDTKIRLRLRGHVRFYYPDASIVCRPNPQQESFQDEPAVLFEVLSPSTRRIDEGEKKDAYLEIPSLAVYVLIEQEAPEIVVFRRTPAGFVREEYAGLEAVIPLGEVDMELPLREIYEAVTFSPEPGDGEE